MPPCAATVCERVGKTLVMQEITTCLSSQKKAEFSRDIMALGEKWCGQEDSNFHGLPHNDLNVARLPIPPWPRVEGFL